MRIGSFIAAAPPGIGTYEKFAKRSKSVVLQSRASPPQMFESSPYPVPSNANPQTGPVKLFSYITLLI